MGLVYRLFIIVCEVCIFLYFTSEYWAFQIDTIRIVRKAIIFFRYDKVFFTFSSDFHISAKSYLEKLQRFY